MSYRIDEEQGLSIVIDGFESSIAPSPYLGIANIRNMNTSYYPGAAYVNYRRQQATTGGNLFFAGSHSVDVSNNVGWLFEGVTSNIMGNPVAKATSPAGLNYVLDDEGQIFKQTAVNSNTFNKIGNGTGRLGTGAGGLAYWNNYLIVFGDSLIEFCGLGTDDDDVTASNWNSNPIYARGYAQQNTVAPETHFSFQGPVGGVQILEGSAIQFSAITGTLPSPFVAGTTYYSLDTALENGDLFEVSATPGGTPITYTVDSSALVFYVTNVTDRLPIGNCTNLIFTLNTTHTIGTIVSYTDQLGNTISGAWQGVTGQYNLIDPLGNNILGNFTTNSATINFPNPLVYFDGQISATYEINILNPDNEIYKTYVSKADGNLYFANGRNLGRILSQNATTNFNPDYFPSYVVDYAVTEILQPNDEITDMCDLNSILVISGNKDIYNWDYLSATTTAPSPVGEQIFSMINLLNNIYILAGQKGNIYTTNGYSTQIYYKIPDFIAGIIDPVWSWGGIMGHRSKLYFQILAQSTSGTNLLAGIFSLIVSPTINEKSEGLVMEAQNSYGLTPASGALANGVLMDDSPSSTGYDSYYSAWSNGATTGGIDYNDTSLWQNFEPTIETDIIPIGTILDKKTFGNIEFKLDRPMVTGDQIRLYWRPSLSDSYILIGTTTNNVLSDYKPSNISQSQWAQFKAQTKCASSGSSFIPIKEIRLHYN